MPKVEAPAPSKVTAPLVGRKQSDMKLVAQRANRAPAADYSHLDRPAVQRQPRAVGDGLRASYGSEDVLDIPAFLRRQAD
jgi:hypothetical protein